MLIDHCRMPKPIKWHCSISFYFFPRKRFISNRAFVQVIEARLAVIPSKNVKRPVILTAGVVCALARLLALGLDLLPVFCSQIVHEKVVVKVAGFLLVPAKEE